MKKRMMSMLLCTAMAAGLLKMCIRDSIKAFEG